MKLFLKNACCCLLVFVIFSCKNANKNSDSFSTEKSTQSKEAMILNIDGETYKYKFDDLSGDCFWDVTAEIVRAKFRTRLDKTDIKQLTLNFNLWGSDLISSVPNTFDVVNTSNQGVRRADVNIVDLAERNLSQSLALINGSITVHQWTEDHIHFSFEGEAGEMLNPQTTVPISGTVNMKCSKR